MCVSCGGGRPRSCASARSRSGARPARGRRPPSGACGAPSAGWGESVFQLAGPGAVGVGSLRGMPHLLELDGFSVWPFDPPGPARVLEIYPRALTGRVDKGRWASRHAYLERYAGQDPMLLERAAGSEDAFDAAVSALVMGAHADEFAALQQTDDPVERLEGRIWLPRSTA